MTATQKKILTGTWLLAAFLVIWVYVTVSGFEPTYFPEQMGKPFAYRVMAVTLVRTIAPLFPETIFGHSAVIQQLSQGSAPNYGVAAYLVMYAALLLVGWGIYTLLSDLGYALKYRLLGVALFSVLTASVFTMCAQVYDLPHAAIMIWALVFLYRRRLAGFYTLIVLGMFSRETIIFLLPLYFLLEPSRRRAGIALACFALFALVRLGIGRMLAGLPESTDPYGLILFRQVGLTWPFLVQHSLYLLLVLIALVGWSRKPVFLRTAYAVLMGATIAAYLWTGYPGEVRVFMEASLVLVMMYLPVAERLPGPAARIQLEDGRTVA